MKDEIVIMGAKGSVDTEKLLDWVKSRDPGELGFDVQFLNADAIYGLDHVLTAVEHAMRAFERGTNSASSLMVEIVLYAAAERQITRALEKVGVRRGVEHMAAVFIGKVDEERALTVLSELGLERDDAVLEGTERVLELFGIGEQERKATLREKWGDLILERVALLDLEK